MRLRNDFQVTGAGGTYPLGDPLTPLKLLSAIRRNAPDVFWSPGFMPPLASPVPFIFTMHDLIHIHSADSLRRSYYNLVIRPLSKKAYRIATVSAFSQGEICDWTGLPPEKVPIIYNGVSEEFSPIGAKFDPGYPYLFYVGARKAHKNLEAMLLAFARSGLSGKCCLLLSGKPDENLQQLAVQLDIARDLHFSGFIAECDLPSYYRGAAGVIMVSKYEGFGLPVLEAMASGVPVLCSNTTSLAEIGGDAVLSVDPLDIEEIAHGMRMILEDSDLRERLATRGQMRAKIFQWDKSAARLSSLISEAGTSTSH
jgi:glycosyltransferase involved in cell wall biosynthesis